jgi:hypothetical protein
MRLDRASLLGNTESVLRLRPGSGGNGGGASRR